MRQGGLFLELGAGKRTYLSITYQTRFVDDQCACIFLNLGRK